MEVSTPQLFERYNFAIKKKKNKNLFLSSHKLVNT